MITVTAAASTLPGRQLPPGAAAEAVLGAAAAAPVSTEPRHVGQESCETSQASTQRTWNSWPHRGSTRTLSPSANSPRQMAHTSDAPADPPDAPYTSMGRLLSVRFFLPLLIPPPPPPPPPCTAAASSSTPPSPDDAARRAHRMTHRASELSPSAKSRAKRRAARMITMLVSKLASLPPPALPLLLLSARCASPPPLLPGGAGEPGGPPMYQLMDLACVPILACNFFFLLEMTRPSLEVSIELSNHHHAFRPAIMRRRYRYGYVLHRDGDVVAALTAPPAAAKCGVWSACFIPAPICFGSKKLEA
ncbi:hypothetical protein BRADI_2g53561v3 [Brachypodium distachyon]|uniref:Uncharacterized protein n=1 Tax=Brachypodium distachyon TaxID=15368 RepID=A0A2K2DFR1_BRADI|nr:hypothetical protein BRADI_2g53561v3 [Brachypodium distachyon]